MQFVDFHCKGHILDLICCSGVIPYNCRALDLPISDHKLISFSVNLMDEKNNMGRSISFRNMKDIDLSALSDGLDNFFRSNVFSTPDDLVSYYNEGLHSVLDTLAPLKTRTVYFNCLFNCSDCLFCTLVYTRTETA